MKVEKVTEGQIVDFTSGPRLFFNEDEKKNIYTVAQKYNNSHKPEVEH